MAVTKIIARHYRVDTGINYILNGDKTEDRLLTAFQYCGPDNAYATMMQTKRDSNKMGGVQCYHIVQAFRPGEVSPELALEIAQQFVKEHLPDYEAVIGVHVDKKHIHAHIVFNSVSRETGKKYHSNAQSYYQKIRGISDRLCAEHGLSVIMTGESSRSISYYEWMREKRGQPTFRSMLEADLRHAIDDANDYGHFLMLMEHMCYEVKHGSRLSFRLRGQERWMVPGRGNALFTEEGIRQAIHGNLEAIEAGLKPVITQRRIYTPFKKHPKYTGFLALYVHYLYLLGKIEKRQYPPRMTAQLKAEVMKFEKYKAQFNFLRERDISNHKQLTAFQEDTESRIAALTKQRTILNVRKKGRKQLYDALSDVQALQPAAKLYAEGMTGIEEEFTRYMDAVKVLEQSGISREQLAKEKGQVYEQIADVNREIHKLRGEQSMCREILEHIPQIEKELHQAERPKEKEVKRDVRRK